MAPWPPSKTTAKPGLGHRPFESTVPLSLYPSFTFWAKCLLSFWLKASLSPVKKPTLWPSPGWNFVFSHSLLTARGDKTLGLPGNLCWEPEGERSSPSPAPVLPLASCQAASQPLINQPRRQTAYCSPRWLCQNGNLPLQPIWPLPVLPWLSHHSSSFVFSSFFTPWSLQSHWL